MKFLNDLYTIVSLDRVGNKLSVVVRLNPLHGIFNGHFPGNPVLPGVCIIQILKELLEMQNYSDLVMSEAASIKYISFIVPVKDNTVTFDIVQTAIDNANTSCNCSVFSAENVFCKLRCVFRSG